MKIFLGAFFFFGNIFAGQQVSLLGTIQEVTMEYDTFVGQSVDDIIFRRGQEQDTVFVTISDSEEAQEEQPSHFSGLREWYNQKTSNLNMWCNQDTHCVCAKLYPRKVHFCVYGCFALTTGMTALCYWYLKDFHPPCDPDNC